MKGFSPWLWISLGAATLYVLTRPSESAAETPPDTDSEEPPTDGPPSPVVLDYGPMDLLTGSAFMRSLGTTTGPARETAIEQALRDRQYPVFLNGLVDVPVASGALRGTIHVMPDFLGVGVGTDWIRMPMLPGTAQRVADALAMLLPTKKMADAIHAAAPVKVRMPFVATRKESNAAYSTADASIIRRTPAGTRQGTLIDGQKKYVLTASRAHPRSVIIYGAENPDTGAWPLQPKSFVHSDTYVDYSHGIRLIAPTMMVQGRGEIPVRDVMASPELAPLISDTSDDRNTRYRV